MFPTSPKFSLLQQEGYLCRSCLRTGLFALKNANLGNKGDFYVAFFQLSIGLERLMKLTLILDYMVANQLNLPDNNWLKSFSHRLTDILRNIELIEKRVSNKDDVRNILKPASFELEILTLLDEFAQKTRYANLDGLTGKQNLSDPLEKWGNISQRIFEKEVPENIKQQLLGEAVAASSILSGHSVVLFSDLGKKPLSFEDGYWQQNMFKVVSPHMIWMVMKIIHPIYSVMCDVSGLAQGTNLSLFHNEMIVGFKEPNKTRTNCILILYSLFCILRHPYETNRHTYHSCPRQRSHCHRAGCRI
jgi:hypothetical protein